MPNYRVLGSSLGTYPHGTILPPGAPCLTDDIEQLVHKGIIEETDDPVTEEVDAASKCLSELECVSLPQESPNPPIGTDAIPAKARVLSATSETEQYNRFLELRALMKSPENREVSLDTLLEYQQLHTKFGVYTVDTVSVGPPHPTRVPNEVPILNTDCITIPGTTPRVCPRSSPKLPAELLPQLQARFRSLRLVSADHSILWVGRQAEMDTLCMYHQGCTCFKENAPPLQNETQVESGKPVTLETLVVTSTGWMGADELADTLGVHSSRKSAFIKKLERERKNLGDEVWQEVSNPRKNSPRYLYRLDAPSLRELAEQYKSPKTA